MKFNVSLPLELFFPSGFAVSEEAVNSSAVPLFGCDMEFAPSKLDAELCVVSDILLSTGVMLL